MYTCPCGVPGIGAARLQVCRDPRRVTMSAALRRVPANFMFSWCRHLASDANSLPPADALSPGEDRTASVAVVPDANPEKVRRRTILARLAPCFNNAAEDKFPRAPGGAQPPWTPTSQLDKRKTYKTRSQNMLRDLRSEYSSQVAEEKNFPSFRAGDVLEVDLVCSHTIGATRLTLAFCKLCPCSST